jgi:hypothetical protein
MQVISTQWVKTFLVIPAKAGIQQLLPGLFEKLPTIALTYRNMIIFAKKKKPPMELLCIPGGKPKSP